MEIEGITLWLFGGVARFKEMFPTAGAEFRIAIAGPLVTLALAAGLLSVIPLSARLPPPGGAEGVEGRCSRRAGPGRRAATEPFLAAVCRS
jgi:Zn-dependent protease